MAGSLDPETGGEHEGADNDQSHLSAATADFPGAGSTWKKLHSQREMTMVSTREMAGVN